MITIFLSVITAILIVFLYRLLCEELGVYSYKEKDKNKDHFDKFD